jgi:hypothetical protein
VIDPFDSYRDRLAEDPLAAYVGSPVDPTAMTAPTRGPVAGGSPEPTPEIGRQGTSSPEATPTPGDYDQGEARRAAAEDPFGDQPIRQAAYLRWQQLDPARREAAFGVSVDKALTAEGITDPAARDHWRQAMLLVAKGDAKTPGENPSLNPFAQAYDLPDRPGQGVNPKYAGTPQGDATASSARGYFQFLTKSNGSTPSTWELVRLPSKAGEEELAADDVFDPVANARGYIRAVNRSTNYRDPMDPWREKQRKQVWNPLLPMPAPTRRP